MAIRTRTKTRVIRVKSRVHHKRKVTIPLAIVAGFIPAINDVRTTTNSAFPVWDAAMHTGAGLLGWDTIGKKFVGWTQMRAAGTPGIIMGFAAHWLAQKLGLNRMIARAGIPWVRI